MTTNKTVKELSAELRRPVAELLGQLREAGVAAADESAMVSAGDRVRLLQYLRGLPAGTGAARPATPATAGGGTLSLGAGKIALKRTETSELRQTGPRGAPSRAIAVEVVKKRVYSRPEEEQANAPVAEASADDRAEQQRALAQAEAEHAAAVVRATETEAARRVEEESRAAREAAEEATRRAADEARAAEAAEAARQAEEVRAAEAAREALAAAERDTKAKPAAGATPKPAPGASPAPVARPTNVPPPAPGASPAPVARPTNVPPPAPGASPAPVARPTNVPPPAPNAVPAPASPAPVEATTPPSAADAASAAAADAAAAAERLHAQKMRTDSVYRMRYEAEQMRKRAEENLRRAAEAAKKAQEDKEKQKLEQARSAGAAARPGVVVRSAPGAPPRPASSPAGAARPGGAGRGGVGGARGRDRDRDREGVDKYGRRGRDEATAPALHIVREVEIPEAITVAELANRMAVKAVELIKVMMKNGVMATINQIIDQDTASIIVEDMGHTPKMVKETDFEDSLTQAAEGIIDADQETITRPPVVTIMGHVDHGKTSLLDYIRKTRVAAGEAGGITQHIGAYHVTTPRGVITFLDTPGHAAFTRMRARGAKITDVVVLVVAGDDGVMPQTREAIKHARAAKAQMVVAVTKIDKPASDLSRVKNEMLKEDVVAEDFGGDDPFVGVSSVSGEGIDALLEEISIRAELQDLRAPVDAKARGAIIESSVEKGRGPVATVLVRSGTLRQGDVILAGPYFGRVRAMFDEAGKPVKEAGPSIPVQVLGLSGTPDAGDDMVVVADERKARELAIFREGKQRDQKLATNQALRLSNAFAQMGEGEQKTLNVLVKADVQGSAEAISDALRHLPSEEVNINVISSGVGGISESDVDLAVASKAIIIAFNVRADGPAKKRVQDTGVDLRYYSIIYDILDEVTAAVTGLLGTETREQIVGTAQVREVFRSSKLGDIAGCLVVEGRMEKSLPIRVLRNNTVIFEGVLESLRRFKDDVARVEAGTECGIGVKDYSVKVGDQVECFQRIEVKRTIGATSNAGATATARAA